jgi:hypothetical protein
MAGRNGRVVDGGRDRGGDLAGAAAAGDDRGADGRSRSGV